MIPALFVIDDFLADAAGLRSRALQLQYKVNGLYPGLNSVEKIEIDGLNQIVSAIVRQPVHTPWSPDFSHAHFRLALGADASPGRIHTDPSQLSGILYLSRAEDCRGGTEFYRHLPTQTDRLPMTIEEVYALGYDSFEAIRAVFEEDITDRSKWELTMSVPMRFNRLVLLQPHYWHTSGAGFGDSVENGRLIYVMFFKVGTPAA